MVSTDYKEYHHHNHFVNVYVQCIDNYHFLSISTPAMGNKSQIWYTELQIYSSIHLNIYFLVCTFIEQTIYLSKIYFIMNKQQYNTKKL